MRTLPIAIPQLAIEKFCGKAHIRKLALFGSVLRDDFRPDSDVDVLVEFDPRHIPGLSFFAIRDELSKLLGRKVDLNTSGDISPLFRDQVEREAEVVYVEP
jgi:predicted nucleotidyltransferase